LRHARAAKELPAEFDVRSRRCELISRVVHFGGNSCSTRRRMAWDY